MSAKRRKGVKKAVHFGGASRIPEECDEAEEAEEQTVTTLSLSVQVPTVVGRKMGEKEGQGKGKGGRDEDEDVK